MDRIVQSVIASGTIPRGAVVIVGVSGGPDSLCLLHVLDSIRKEQELTLFPVHVNHKLREKAAEEQAHVEEFCKSLGLTCSSVEVDVREMASEIGVGEEEAGRVARYHVFTQIAAQAEEQGVSRERIRIATAHNADDQSETVLQHVLRGTGLRGLAGIPQSRLDESGFYIVRPLLGVTRAEIEAYIEAHALVPNQDESNQELIYQRNRIRLELLPLLEREYNPNIRAGLRQLAGIAALDDHYLEQVTSAVFNRAADYDTARDVLTLDTEVLASQHPAILRRVIALTMRTIGINSEISYGLVHEVIAVLFSDRPSAQIKLPDNIIAEREYRKLVFRTDTGVKRPVSPNCRLVTSVMPRGEFKEPEGRPYAAFDLGKLSKVYPGQIGQITLRTRMEGDRIAIGKDRHQKIQDFLVDAKVPKGVREEILMVAVGSEVLWILPHDALPTAAQREKGKYSQNYQITDRTKQVILLEIHERL